MKQYIQTINNKFNIISILNILEGYNKLKRLIQKDKYINKTNSIVGDIIHKNNFLRN